MPEFLLLIGIIILLCVVCNRVSQRLGIPMLLIFILLGMFFGTDGIVKIPFDDFLLAERICSAALVFIMFYGGFGTNWKQARPVAVQSVLLSTLGVVLTACLTGLFCHFVLRIAFWESMLIGAVTGSTDAASVFSILRSKKLSLRHHTDSLLEVESGSNDPCSYMLTAIILSVMSGTATGGEIAYLVFAQLVYGVVSGILMALLSLWVLRRFRFATQGFDTIFVVAMVLFSYALPTVFGGNGYLSAYLFGILLGNRPLPNKKQLVHFFDGVTGLMQMLIFFLLGLLSFPSQMPAVLVPALLIALFLTFVARPAAVFLLLTPFRCPPQQQLLVAWSGLRGAASIVFAVMTVISPAVTDHDLFHIVFVVVLLSISLQGSLLPAVAKKLDMIDTDEDADVMKTFTDYSGEAPVQFIRVHLPEGHSWCGKPVRELALPPQTILASVRRGDARFAPNGSTVLQAEDQLILCAPTARRDLEEVHMTERRLTEQELDMQKGTRINALPRQEGSLIVLIQRGESWLIPDGDTLLQPGDRLLIHHSEE